MTTAPESPATPAQAPFETMLDEMLFSGRHLEAARAADRLYSAHLISLAEYNRVLAACLRSKASGVPMRPRPRAALTDRIL